MNLFLGKIKNQAKIKIGKILKMLPIFNMMIEK